MTIKTSNIRELKPFHGAKWITQSYLADERPQECKTAAFRRDYTLSEIPKSCILHIAAFKSCVLWINGERVFNSHIRFFVNNVRYDRIDVAKYLKSGKNSFAVVLNPPTGSTGYTEFARAGVIINSDMPDNCCNEKIRTDDSWFATVATWYGIGDRMISVPTVFQEHFNAYEKEPVGWQTDNQYTKWTKAFAFGCAGVAPFKNMSERDIPPLIEEYTEPICVWKGSDDRILRDIAGNLAVSFNSSEKTGKVVHETAAKLFTNDCDNIFTFDYGKTSYIRPAVEVADCKGHVRIEFYYSMELNDTPNAFRGFSFDCEGFSDSYAPIEGSSQWCALSPKGFRFMTIRICGEGSISFKPTALRVSYPYGEEKKIAGDPCLEQIWHLAAETLKSATNDTIVDTCTRENVLWTFDALVGGEAAYHTFGDLKMWRRCLALIGEGIDDDGNFRTVVPAGDSFMKLIDQNLYWITSCFRYFEYSGDHELLEFAQPKISALLRLCSECITDEGLFTPPVFAWHWVDWATIDRRPYSLPINCILILAAESAVKIADIVDNNALCELSEKIIKTLRPSCERFYSENEGSFVCRIEPKGEMPEYNSFNFLKDEDVTALNIHAICLACAAMCGTEEMRTNSLKTLVKLMHEDIDDRRLGMGPGWIEILLSTLVQHGYTEEAKMYIKTKYGYVLDSGAPTIGEGLGKGKFNTSHAWGSCVNSLIALNKDAFGVSISD